MGLEMIKPSPDLDVVAKRIKEHYDGKGVQTNLGVIRKVLEYSNYSASETFPGGPFTAKDLAAIAMVETNFSQYAVGKSGERGIFQIYDYHTELREMGLKDRNIFDLDVNAMAVCHELKKKYKKHQDYYTSIIAYNGYRVDNNGNLRTHYWKKFAEAREFIEGIWSEDKYD